MTLQEPNRAPLSLILTQPNFPVPATHDGASATIISDTLECLPDEPLASLSLWDKRHDDASYDKNRNLLWKHNSWGGRLLRKLLLQNRRYEEIFRGLDSRQQGLLIGLKAFQYLYHPCSVVVHTTKPDWVLRVKRLCGKNTKVIGYYHHSELHLVDPLVLTNLMRELDGHVFVSNFAAKSFEAVISDLGLHNTSKIFCVRNGVDPEKFKTGTDRLVIRQQLGIEPEKKVLLFCGRLVPRKGIHCLLKAILELPDDVLEKIVLVIAGSYDYHNNLQTEYIAELHDIASNPRLNGKVMFKGYVSHCDVPLYYQASDVFLLPSIGYEGLPLSILEAQMSSLPVIASSIGGAPEALIPEATGFLIDPPGEPLVIARLLEPLVRNPTMYDRLARNAREYAISEFSRDKMASNFLRVVRTIC